METLKTLVLTGYRSYEIGVFNENDPKIKIIKNCIKMELRSYLEQGLEWILTSGQLGAEMWGAQAVFEMKEEFPDVKLAVIFPFEGFGSQWNEQNKLSLAHTVQQADYVNAVSHKEYESPQQLRNHTRFLLEHSGGAMVVHDDASPGKAQYFLKEAEAFQKLYPYVLHMIDFYDLQSFAENRE